MRERLNVVGNARPETVYACVCVCVRERVKEIEGVSTHSKEFESLDG